MGCVSSGGRSKIHVKWATSLWRLLFSRGPQPCWTRAPTRMTSLNLYHLLTGPVSTYRHVQVSGFNTGILGGRKHSVEGYGLR